MNISKSAFYLCFVVGGIYSSCSPSQTNESHLTSWAGQQIDLKHIVSEKDSFIMLNSEGQKIGGMIWEKTISGNRYIHKDISYFDDGSVYEEASFHYQLDPLIFDSVQVEIQTPSARMNVNFRIDDKRIKGPLIVTRDTNRRVMQIDSLFEYDIVRPEIYSLIHSMIFENVTEIPLRVFSPEGLVVAEARVINLGKETIDEGYGKFDCTKVELKGGGVIPDNIIWISENPRRIVKVYVPEPALTIVLAKVN